MDCFNMLKKQKGLDRTLADALALSCRTLCIFKVKGTANSKQQTRLLHTDNKPIKCKCISFTRKRCRGLFYVVHKYTYIHAHTPYTYTEKMEAGVERISLYPSGS